MPKKQVTKKVTVINNKTKQPKKPRSKKKNKKANRRMGLGACTYEYARSLANPFEYSSCIPDGSVGTGVFSVKQQFTISSGTGTCAGIIIGSDPKNAIITDSGSTVAQPTIPATWTALFQVAQMAGFYAKYRPVSFGLRAYYAGNTQTDGGTLILGQLSGGVTPSQLNGVSVASFCNYCQSYEILPLRSGGQLTWRPEDMMDAAQFLDLTTTPSVTTNKQAAPYLACYVYGANSSQALLTVEVCWNFEGQYNNMTWSPGGANGKPLAPAEMGWYERARDVINSVDQILPMMAGSNFGRMAGNAALGYLGSLGNGFMNPRGFGASMPRLLTG
jgi:hypothetical protein